jgi:hypothetical protein
VRHDQLLVDGADAVILRNGSAHDLLDGLSRLAQDTIDQLARDQLFTRHSQGGG